MRSTYGNSLARFKHYAYVVLAHSWLSLTLPKPRYLRNRNLDMLAGLFKHRNFMSLVHPSLKILGTNSSPLVKYKKLRLLFKTFNIIEQHYASKNTRFALLITVYDDCKVAGFHIILNVQTIT